MKCITIVRIVLALLGVLLIGLGAGLGWGAFPGIVEDTVEENIDLTDQESEGYKNFVVPPVPVYMRFTFFNFENPVEFATGTEKPKFEEKGPYVYREVREKRELKYGAQTLNYSQYRHFQFDKGQSCADCNSDDTVTILNMPLIGAVITGMDMGHLLGQSVITALSKAITSEADLALTDTVDNILFSGVSKESNPIVNVLMTNYNLKKRLPPAIQENGFAIFNSKNATTHNENYQVWTDVDRHTKISLWGPEVDELVPDLSTIRQCPTVINGYDPGCSKFENPVWWPNPDAAGEDGEKSYCNQIRGTNAEQFPPFLDDRIDDELWIFTTDLCRSMYLKYLREEKIDGIKVLRYSVPIDGGNINKKNNLCFCKDFHEKENRGCFKNSTVEDEFDISECKFTTCANGLQSVENCMKSPVIMCSPHFFMAEQELENFGDDMKRPEAEADRTYLDIEPTTGMVLRAHKKIQINMPIVPLSSYSEQEAGNLAFLRKITAMKAFPVLWLDEGADIDEENIDKIKSMVTIPLLALDIVKYGAIALGGVLLLVGALMCC